MLTGGIDVGKPFRIATAEPSGRYLKYPHQKRAVDSLSAYFELSHARSNRRGLLVMPTGSGKTYTAVYWLLKEAVANDFKVVWVAHRTELIDQAFLTFAEETALLKDSKKELFVPTVVSGEHRKMAETIRGKDVYVLSRASAANKGGLRHLKRIFENSKNIIMVIDEAHHAVAGQYLQIWDILQKNSERAHLLGLTATPTRISEKSKEELEDLFNVRRNGYVYQVTLAELLKNGFLAKPIPVSVGTGINAVKEFKITDKDIITRFGEKELTQEALDRIAENAGRNKFIVSQYMKNRETYGKTIVFAINIEHAKRLCEDFNDALKPYGWHAEYVASRRDDDGDNQEIISRFKSNKDKGFKVLINVQIMTEGSDVPDVQTVFLTRQTASDVLLMQMIGRGLRGPDAGGTKEAYLVFFIDNWESRFNYWLNPEELEIFQETEEYEKEATGEPEEELPEIVAREFPQLVKENEDGEFEIPIPEPRKDISEWDALYQQVYAKISMEGNQYKPSPNIIPVGWYSVGNEKEGEHRTLIVFNNQKKYFENIKANLKKIILKYENKNRPGYVDMFNQEYFQGSNRAAASEILRYIKTQDRMPPYFSFAEQEGFSPDKLAKKLKNKQFRTDHDRTEWLKHVYDNNPVLPNIYGLFINFKNTVLDAMKGKTYPAPFTESIKKQPYVIGDSKVDLEECLEEVLSDYKGLNKEGLVRIQWSPKPCRNWYALCQRNRDRTKFQITVNKLLCSSNISKELIKYLIFHELLHKNGYWNHDKDFRSREWQFKDSVSHDAFLDGALYDLYDLEPYYKEMPKRTVIPFPEGKE